MGDVIKHVKVPGVNFKSKDIVTEKDLYQNEKKVLQLLIHNKAEQKIVYYDKKIVQMKQKYNMDYLTFERSIGLKAEYLDFEKLDDLVLWGSYVKAHQYWEQYVLP